MVPWRAGYWALKKPGRKKYKLLFQNGSFKKKVLKYGRLGLGLGLRVGLGFRV